MKKVVSHSIEDTAKIASQWLVDVSGKHTNSGSALVVGLSGQLGAGKTAFTKAVARELGITEEVTSPTFVIMKIYPLVNQPWKRLIHIDAYRLEKPEELGVLGFERLVADPENLILIEWPENVKEAIESLSTYELISFSVTDVPTERGIEFSTR